MGKFDDLLGELEADIEKKTGKNAFGDLLDTLETGKHEVPDLSAARPNEPPNSSNWTSYQAKCGRRGVDYKNGYRCWFCQSKKWVDRPFEHGVARDCKRCGKLSYFAIWQGETKELPHESHEPCTMLPQRDDPAFKKMVEDRKRAAAEFLERGD